MKLLRQMHEKGIDFLHRGIGEKGQTMIEYALVGVLIAIVLVFVFRSPGVNSGLSTAASRINSALMTPG